MADKIFKDWEDLNAWLRSEAGKNALNLDTFNKDLQSRYNEQIKIGREMHNIEKDLKELQTVYADAGFSRTQIQETSTGTKITFLPHDPNVDVKDCPFIEISKENDGLVIHNGMVAYNSPVALMNGANQLGFVSETSLALHEVAEEVKRNMQRIKTASGFNQRAKLLNTYTRRAARTSMETMASIFDKKGLKDLSEYNSKAILSKRPESIKAQTNQLHYARLIKQMYEKAKDAGKLSYGVDLKKFGQQVEDVINLARSVKDINELEKGLRMYQERNYDMLRIWDTQLKNFLGPIIKDLTQGGMTEGTSGRLGLQEIDSPFSVLTNTGKKPTQNTQVFPQKTNFAKNLKNLANKQKQVKTVAIGMNKLFTQTQKSSLIEKGLSEEELHKDLYGVAYISEKDIERALNLAKDKLKKGEIDKKTFDRYRLLSLKGFGKDASLMSASLAAEMSDITENRPLKDIDVSFINQRIVARLTKEIQRKKENKGKSKDEINKLVDDVVKDFNYFELTDAQKGQDAYKNVRRYFKEEMRSLFGIDDLTGRRGGVDGSGFNYQYNKETGMLTNISTFRKTDAKAFVSRVGLTGDYRSSSSAIDDDWKNIVLEAAFGGKKDFFNKINILRSNDRGFSGKSIETDIKEVLNYISMYATQDWLSKNPLLSQFITMDNSGDFIVDNAAVEKFFTETKKDSEGKQKFVNSASKFLVDISKLAADLNPEEYQNTLELISDEETLKTIYGDKYDPKKNGPILVSKGPRITATEFAKSSTFTYSGMGALSGSSHSTTWRERHAVENTYEKFSQFLLNQGYEGEEYSKAIKPLKALKESIEAKFERNEQEYGKIVRNSENLAQTFKKNAVKFQKDIAKDETSIVLNIEDIMKTYAEVEYNSKDPSNPGMALNTVNPEEVFVLAAEKMAKERFKQLQTTHKNDWEAFSERTGVRSVEDLMGRFFVNLGDDRLVGKYNGEALSTGMIALPEIRYNKKALDNGVLSLYDGGKYATNIVRDIQNIYNGTYLDKDEARRHAFYTLVNSYDDYYKSITKGSEYERTHTSRDDASSGRLVTDALSANTPEVLRSIAKEIVNKHKIKGKEKDKVVSQLENVSMVLSTKDYKAMWHKRLQQGSKEDIQKTKEEIDSLFNSLYTEDERNNRKDLKNIKSRNYKGKIAAIAQAFDISDKYYKGRVITDLGWNRDPTINFLRDVNGGTAVLDGRKEGAIVAQGHILINKDLLAIGHGDMDGDLIAMYLAYQSGDVAGFERALEAFYRDGQEQQRKVSEEEDKKDKEMRQKLSAFMKQKYGKDFNPDQLRYGEQSKVDSVQDLSGKTLSVGAMWSGKKGSGIFGDLAFAQENLVQHIKHLDPNTDINGAATMGANVLQALAQSLYQKGINIKNAGKLAESLGQEAKENYSPGELAAMVHAQTNEMFEMINQADTFNDTHQLRRFIEKGESIGAYDFDKMFVENALTTLGLQDLDEQGLQNLLEVAEGHLKRLEDNKDDEKYITRIKDDIDAINKAKEDPKKNKLMNMTSELVIALINDLNYRHQFFHGELGNFLANRYYEGLIPGHGSNQIKRFNKSIENDPDKQLEKYLEEHKDEESVKEFLNDTTYGRYLKAKKNGMSTMKGMSATAGSRNIMYTLSRYGANADNSTMLQEIQGQEVNGKILKPEDILKKYSTEFVANPSLKNVARDMMMGQITHRTAEAYEKYGDKYLESKEYQKEVTDYVQRLTALYGAEEANKIKDDAVRYGIGNYKNVLDIVNKNGGKIIGSELALAGYGGFTKTGAMKGSRQIADIVYKLGNELIIGDYKTYNHAQAGADAILQVYDYMEALKMLQLAMRDERSQSANTFLHSNNVEAANWRKRLGISDKDTDAGRKSKEAQFAKIFNAINQGTDITSIGGRIFVRDTTSGLLREYKVKDSDGLRDLYKRSKEENLTFDQLIQKGGEEEQNLINKSLELIRTSTEGMSDEEKRNLFSKDSGVFANARQMLKIAQAQLKLKEVQKKLYESLQEKGLLSKKDISDYEQLIKETEELKNKIGAEGEFEKLSKDIKETEENLNKAIEAKSEAEISLYREQLKRQVAAREMAKDTLAYKSEQAEKKLRQEGINEDLQLGNDIADITKTTIDEAEEERNKILLKEQKKQLAKEQLLDKNKEYQKKAKEAAEAVARSESSLLSKEEREIAEEQAKDLIQERDSIREYLNEQLKSAFSYSRKKKTYKFTGPDGKKITQQQAEKMGYYLNTEQFDEDELRKARKDVELSDHRAMVSFETKAYNFLKDQSKREEELAKMDEKINKAQAENDEVELEALTSRKERLQKIYGMYNELEKAELEKERGYTPEGLQKIKNLVDLEKGVDNSRKQKEQRAQASARGGQGGNGGPGYSFLGIDAGVSRWVSRLMSGGMFYRFIAMIRRGLHSLTQEAKQLDQAMITLRIVTGKNAENARTLINQYADLGKKLGATAVEVTNVSSAWLRQGYDISQVNDLIKSSMYLSKLGMIDVNEAVKDLEIRSAK
ncbi:MAG: hypothetical protein J6T10_04635 [Methanobrevibacter sp.]|nr:hypothetical protein [Methanobrevibacter sp.]